MGYTTYFTGSVTVTPPLNAAEIEYLDRFASVRHMDRAKGPYYANPGADGFGQDEESDIRNYNSPGAVPPGPWCQWVVSGNGTNIEWDGNEKFYSADEWMAYIIDHFLKPGAKAKSSGDPQFAEFTFDHMVNGVIDAAGEDPSDLWRIVVEDNKVSTQAASITYA